VPQAAVQPMAARRPKGDLRDHQRGPRGAEPQAGPSGERAGASRARRPWPGAPARAGHGGPSHGSPATKRRCGATRRGHPERRGHRGSAAAPRHHYRYTRRISRATPAAAAVSTSDSMKSCQTIRARLPPRAWRAANSCCRVTARVVQGSRCSRRAAAAARRVLGWTATTAGPTRRVRSPRERKRVACPRALRSPRHSAASITHSFAAARYGGAGGSSAETSACARAASRPARAGRRHAFGTGVAQHPSAPGASGTVRKLNGNWKPSGMTPTTVCQSLPSRARVR
jgi:hypothetical protein